MGANEDLVESICLVHDIGHSPFGHSGEADSEQTDGRSWRASIITNSRCGSSPSWNRVIPDWPGLNLTYELREGIVKHESEYDLSDAQADGFDPDLRASLEAQIANVADELAYNAHDLDDGLRAGLLEPDQLDDLEIWQMLKESIGWNGELFTEQIRQRMIRRMLGIEINDVIEATGALLAELNPASSGGAAAASA